VYNRAVFFLPPTLRFGLKTYLVTLESLLALSLSLFDKNFLETGDVCGQPPRAPTDPNWRQKLTPSDCSPHAAFTDIEFMSHCYNV